MRIKREPRLARYKKIRKKIQLRRLFAMVVAFVYLCLQVSAYAISQQGNIGPQISNLTLDDERKVTVQIDISNYGYGVDNVKSRAIAILKPKLQAKNVEIDLRVRNISTIDSVISSTPFSDDSENFYVALGNSAYAELNDAVKVSNILNLFIEKQVVFIGGGSTTNKSTLDTFISKNKSSGTYIDNSNLDSFLSRLGDYILGRTSISLDLFVGEGKYQDQAYLQQKINAVVKPKLVSANIDADINVKMLRKESYNTTVDNFYFANNAVDSIGDYRNTLLEFNKLENRWNTLVVDPSIYECSSLTLAYNGDLYYISSDKKLYRFVYETKQLKLCSGVSDVSCIITSADGKVYWAKSIQVAGYEYRVYSQVYEYTPATDTNILIMSTPLAPNNASREIMAMGVSLTNKLIYYYSYGSYNGRYYYDINTMGAGYALGCFDLNTKNKLIPEDEFSFTKATIRGGSNVVILEDNKLYIPYEERTNYFPIRYITDYMEVHSFPITDVGVDFAHGEKISYAPYALEGAGSVLKGVGASARISDDNYYQIKNISTGVLWTMSGVDKEFYNVTASSQTYYRQQNSFMGPTVNSFPGGLFYYRFSFTSSRIAKHPITRRNIVTISSLDSVIQNKTFDSSKDAYVCYLGDTNLQELSDYTKKVTIANKLKSGNARFIGLGTGVNYGQFADLIANNNNLGAYYDNSNIDTVLTNLADYILANTKVPTRSFDKYLVISDSSENLNTESGALDNSGLPIYSSTAMRSKDFYNVTGNCSYTFSTSDTVSGFDIYWYNTSLQLIKKETFNDPPTNLISPSNAAYVKVVFTTAYQNLTLSITNNTEASGDNLKYSTDSTDFENDSLEYVYKYDHDPTMINNVLIDNPTDKIALNGLELSVPIKKFTKPGTYKISVHAKDMPKLIPTGPNLIPNGDAETVNAAGQPDGWNLWAVTPSITTFTARSGDSWVINGSRSFQLDTLSRSDGSANACVYRDFEVLSNTDYRFSGLLSAHRCKAYFYIYEMDDQNNILKHFVGNMEVLNNSVPQSKVLDFKTTSETTKLRIHFVKDNTINPIDGVSDFVFADNLELRRLIADPVANAYRKDSLANILPNGDAELVDPDGKISGWIQWDSPTGVASFYKYTYPDWKISGTGSFEIYTPSGNYGTNHAAFYRDIEAQGSTSYQLVGKIGSHRCEGYFSIDEWDSTGKHIKTNTSSKVIDNRVVQDLSISFTTQPNTSRIRINIVKGDTTNPNGTYGDYVFADDVKLLSSKVTTILYAHRLPKAEFSYQIENPGGIYKIRNLADNYLSYDPDHSSRADKGIIDRQWKWAEVLSDGTTTWHDGKVPDTQSFSTGTQVLIWYKVRDTDGPSGKGAWSKPKMVRVDGQLVNPVSLFVARPNPVPMQNEIELSDQSYTLNLGGTITSRAWKIRKVGSTTVNTLTFDRTDAANKKYYKRFNSLGFGTYTITLTVTDSFGRVSNPYSQNITVIDTINPTVTVSMSTGSFTTGPANITVNCYDNTSGNNNNRGLKTITYAWSLNSTSPQNGDTVNTINIPTESVYANSFTTSQDKDGTWYLYIKDIDYAGNSNNNDGYVRYGPYTIVTLNISDVSITGYWNHWRGQVDMSGKQLTVEPHRFLSLEKVKIAVTTTGNPDSVSIRFSPELEAMQYTDPKGNVYDYKDDYFNYYVYFPLGLNSANKTNWNIEYALPLAPSTKGWDDVRKRACYTMVVTATKGATTKTYTVNDIDITGNIYDLTYIQPK